MHKLFENPAAVLIILKLVEAGTGGSQQDDIPGARGVSGGLDGTIRLWNVGTGRCTATVHSYMGGIRSISLSADGERFVTGSVDGTVRVWATRSGLLETSGLPSRDTDPCKCGQCRPLNALPV